MSNKNTKKALLTSVLCLVLCLSMFVSTTFAWFTDSVTSGTNVIAAGNLDVELYHTDKAANEDKVTESTKLFNDVTLWEPGAVAYETLTVKNEGNLALKYNLSINFSNMNFVVENGNLTEYCLAKALKVGVIKDGAESTERDTLVAEVSEWQPLSSFHLSDTMEADGVDHVYTVVIYWEPSNDDNNFNVNNGKTVSDNYKVNGEPALRIDLGVNLVATQKVSESDSFNNDYDENSSAFVSTAEELRAAIATVKDYGTIYVDDGVYNIDSQLTIPGKSINIVGVGENVVIHSKIKNSGYNKIFYIYGSATEGEDVTVNISNVTLTSDIATKSDIWVRTDAQNGKVSGDVTVNLDNVTCTSIICDNNYVDGDTVNLNITNSTVAKVTLDASPFNSNGLNTYTNLNYSASRIDSINIQNGVQDLTHITINGVNPTEKGEQQTLTYVDNVEELQAAIDADADVIAFGADITGDVIVTQKADTKIVIDGNGYTMAGVILVDGKSARYETAGLTIQNVNFEADSLSADAYIRLGNGETATRYTSNVTVKDCTFSGNGIVAVKSYTGGDHNLTITGCTVNSGMHSLAQLKNVEKGLIVTDCEVYSKNGLNVNNSNNLTMSGCTFDVQGYAVRFGESANDTDESFSISDSTLKSACAEEGDAVIEFRKGAVNATLTLTNTTLEGTTQFKGSTSETTIIIDGAQVVESAEALAEALKNGGNVVLTDDMSVSANDTTAANSGYGATGVTVTNGAVLDGKGKTLTVTDANGTWDCAIDADAGTIKNLTVSGAFRGIFMGGASGDVYIDNVIIDNVCYTFNSDAGSKEYGVYISNSTLNGWTSFSDVHKEVVFTNCNFGKGTGGYQYAFCRPFNPVTFKDCAFEAGYVLDISATTGIVLDNCTIGDVLVTADNIEDLIGGTEDLALVATNVTIK